MLSVVDNPNWALQLNSDMQKRSILRTLISSSHVLAVGNMCDLFPGCHKKGIVLGNNSLADQGISVVVRGNIPVRASQSKV